MFSFMSNQAKFGRWPTYVWDPTLAPKGPLFPGRMNSVRIELTWGAFVPQSTGGSLTLKVRMIIPNHWYDKKTNPWSPYYTATCSIGGFLDVGSKGKDVTQQYFDLNINSFIFTNGTNQQYPFDLYKTDIAIFCNYKSAKPNMSPTDPGFTGPLNFFVATDPSNIGFFQSQMIASRPRITTTESVVLVAIPPAKATVNYKTPVSTPTAIASSLTPVPNSGGKTWVQLYCAATIKAMGLAVGTACNAKATSGSFSRRRGRKLINVGDPATIVSLTITAPQTSTFALVDKLTTAIKAGAVTQAFTSVAPSLGFTVGTATPGIINRSGVPNTDDGNAPTTDDLSKAFATDDGASGGSRTDYQLPLPDPTLKPVLAAGVTGTPSYQPTSTYFVKTQAPTKPLIITIPPTASGYTPPPSINGQTNSPTQGYVMAPQMPTDDTLNQLLGIESTPMSEPVIAPIGTGVRRQRGMNTTNEFISDIDVMERVVEEEEKEEVEGDIDEDPVWATHEGRSIRLYDEGYEVMPEGFQLGQYNEKGVFVEHTKGSRERAPYESDEVTMTGRIINHDVRGQDIFSTMLHTMAGSIPVPSPTQMVPTSVQRTLDGFVTPTNPVTPGVPTPALVPGYQQFVQTDFVIAPFKLNVTHPFNISLKTSHSSHNLSIHNPFNTFILPHNFNTPFQHTHSTHRLWQMSLQRVPINIVFPMFLLCVMWLMVIGQLLAYLPFFLRVKPGKWNTHTINIPSNRTCPFPCSCPCPSKHT